MYNFIINTIGRTVQLVLGASNITLETNLSLPQKNLWQCPWFCTSSTVIALLSYCYDSNED